MKISIVGAGGVRMPFIVQSFIARQERLGAIELSLMDIDAAKLKLMFELVKNQITTHQGLRVSFTTDRRESLRNADYVITTFRAGGISARAIDERVALDHGVIGQETTGPGGFAMGMRTIPLMLEYVETMRSVCPDAWLINFANPAGMVTEAVTNHAEWPRVVGICDGPAGMLRHAATLLGMSPRTLLLDYFGLNHLGWARAIWHNGRDLLPDLIGNLAQMDVQTARWPFPPGLVQTIGMLPNPYLYYYYSNEAVANLRAAARTRGEQLVDLNRQLFDDLERAYANKNLDEMQQLFSSYHRERVDTYFVSETRRNHTAPAANDGNTVEHLGDQGYAGVALTLIEALSSNSGQIMILNVPNGGALSGMRQEDVVEVGCWVGLNQIRPLAIGTVPDHALGLMKQVKAFERLTIEAAIFNSYAKALEALTIHPLVPSFEIAKAILDEYIEKHGPAFPTLN